MFETGQTSTRQPLDFSFVSRSLKRYSTKSSSFERTTRLVEHYTAMFYVISMETRVELWVILTHNSLFRHTCRVVVQSVYSTFEHLTQQRYTMSIIQSRVLYSACIVRLNRPLPLKCDIIFPFQGKRTCKISKRITQQIAI